MQRNNHHLGGRIGGNELLQELARAGSQDGIMVHVLQDGDQLQLQVHWRGQACEHKDVLRLLTVVLGDLSHLKGLIQLAKPPFKNKECSTITLITLKITIMRANQSVQ